MLATYCEMLVAVGDKGRKIGTLLDGETSPWRGGSGGPSENGLNFRLGLEYF